MKENVRIAACRLRTGNSLGNRPAKRPLRKRETKAMRRPVGTLRVPGVERPEPEAAEGAVEGPHIHVRQSDPSTARLPILRAHGSSRCAGTPPHGRPKVADARSRLRASPVGSHSLPSWGGVRSGRRSRPIDNDLSIGATNARSESGGPVGAKAWAWLAKSVAFARGGARCSPSSNTGHRPGSLKSRRSRIWSGADHARLSPPWRGRK